MTKARDLADIAGAIANDKIPSNKLDVSFENISDTGTTGTKVASGTTAQRGSTTGEWRYNTTTGFFEGRNASSSFSTLEPIPTVTSVDDTEVDSQAGGNQTIVITGTNFSSGSVASFVGSSASFNASTTTINSSTQITAVAPKSSFLNAQEPYKVKITSSSGIAGTSATGLISVDNVPTFSTASGNLGNISSTATGNHFTISASDPDGDAITFAETGATNITGAGLSLSSSGVISGDPTDVGSDTTVSFTVRATSNGKTSDRAFNVIINPIPDGTSRTLAIPVGATENPITRFLALRGESNNSATEGVYWFSTTNTAGTTYVFPTVIRNFSSHTWLLFGKNMRPHAYKAENSDSNTSGGNSSANNSAHPLSYGLIDSSGNALIANSNILGNHANTTPSASTLGTYHAGVAIKSFGDNVFGTMGLYGRDGALRTLVRSDLTAKINSGQVYNNTSHTDNEFISTTTGAGYMYFNTEMTANDRDTMRLGLTPYNSVTHDRYNTPDEHSGTTWQMDGSDNYTGNNRDTALAGEYGRISLWVK